MIVQNPTYTRTLLQLTDDKLSAYKNTPILSWQKWWDIVIATRDHMMCVVQERGTYDIWKPQPESACYPTQAGFSIYSNFCNFINGRNVTAVVNYLRNTQLHIVSDHGLNHSPTADVLRHLINHSFVLAAQDETATKASQHRCRFYKGEHVVTKDGQRGIVDSNCELSHKCAAVRLNEESSMISWINWDDLALASKIDEIKLVDEEDEPPFYVKPEAGDIVSVKGWGNREAEVIGYTAKGCVKVRTIPEDENENPYQMISPPDHVTFLRPGKQSALMKEVEGEVG